MDDMSPALDTRDPEAVAAAVREALTRVLDPEIRRPITDLGMVRSVDVDTTPAAGALVTVGIDLTTAGCPLRDTITKDVTAAVRSPSSRLASRPRSPRCSRWRPARAASASPP